MLKKIIERIKQGKKFMISAHMNLEGDALGSELAVYNLLKCLGKKATIFNHDRTPQAYQYLPGVCDIKHSIDANDRYDAAIIVDCSDPERTGRVKDYFSRSDCVINIDHHISNTLFGDLNFVKPKASSACEILYELCLKMKVVNDDIALCLYTGIFTDTGKFTYASVTQDTHQVVANLMKFNIKPQDVYENVHSLCTPEDLAFINKIISALKFDSDKRICWATTTKWEEKEYDLTEIIFSTMRLLKGVEVFLLFKKLHDDEIRVNFRSRSVVDVNKIAKFFGGGGHQRASGATVKGSLKGVESKVIDCVKKQARYF